MNAPSDDGRKEDVPSRAGGRRCAICGRPVDPAHAPFCSRRCRLVDLGRWLGEAYRLPAEESERRLPDGRDGTGE